MLSNVLGVITAFVTIILLLSIVVTGLAQATQAAIRLRGRNLLTSVTRLLDATGHATGTRKEKREVAAQVLNSSNIAAVDHVSNPGGMMRRVVLGPRTSWVEARELTAAIKDKENEGKKEGEKQSATPPTATNTDVDADVKKKAEADAKKKAAANKIDPSTIDSNDPLFKAIKRAEPSWCKRFQYFMRLITIAWSVIIAFGFQVSAPLLFSSLSQDPALTAKILEDQPAVMKIAEQAIADDEYDLVSDQALDELAKKYPQFADDIAEAGNAAPTKSELVQQLMDVLPDVPERPEVVDTYSKLVDGLVKKDDTSPDEAAVDKLAAFGITWWHGGADFYVDKVSGNLDLSIIVGVLFTAILLTFGAPFWFEQLRTLAALRDPRAAAAEKKRANDAAKEEVAGTEEVSEFAIVKRKVKKKEE